MKYLIFGFLVLLSVGVNSCSKNEILDNNSSTKDSVVVSVNNCVTIPYTSDTSITYCLDSVLNDSRCPFNANCIWYGYAVARFKFKINSKIYTIELSTLGLNSALKKDITLLGYNISFEELTPENNSALYKDYKAYLKVKKN